jgi:Tol biopolymer transport system component
VTSTSILTPSSLDGKRLAFYEQRGQNRDIWVVDLDEKKPAPFVVSEFNERSPSFSPDAMNGSVRMRRRSRKGKS